MRVNDLVLALACMALATAVVATAYTFPSPRHQAFGPALFPTLIGLGIGVCGLALLIRWLMSERTAAAFAIVEALRTGRQRVDLALLLATPVFYILVVDRLGFVLTAFLCLATLLMRYHGRPLASLLGAAIAAPLLQFVFADVLLVPLPWGILQPIAW